MYTNYRDIRDLLRARRPFQGNSMKAIELDKPRKLYDCHLAITNECYKYVVYSYNTPIAGVTVDGTVMIDHGRYSATTSRHQNLCSAYL